MPALATVDLRLGLARRQGSDLYIEVSGAPLGGKVGSDKYSLSD